MRKEGDARLATLNARREPATQGSYEKAGGNDNDEDGIGETTTPPPRFLPVGICFPAYRKRRLSRFSRISSTQ